MNNKKFTSALVFSISIILVAFVAVAATFMTLLNDTPTYAAAPAVLSSDDMLPLVAFEDGQLKLFGFQDEPQVISGNTSAFMSNHVWSPNGNFLAYLELGENGGNLMLTDSLGSTPQVIANSVNTNMFVFSEDSTQLHYAFAINPNEATSIGDDLTLDVMSYTMGSTSPAMKYGSFKQASCGGGGPSLYDALYWIEAGMGGMRPIFAVIESGILYSNTCSGMGVSIVKPRTGEATVLDNDIIRPVLSADGQTLLGIKNNQLMIIDIATGEKLVVETDSMPEQVIWGADGTGNIYYSVRITTEEVISYTSDEQQKIMNAAGVEVADVAVNQVAIHRLNLETGNDEIVYQNTAYAIGHMTLLPDNRLLMLSEIPSLTTWFEAILDSESGSNVMLETELYLISLEDAEARLLGTGLSNARLNDAAYVRLFGISPQITAQPASVNIGSQIKVTGRNFPIQSRVLLYMGTSANNLDKTPYAAGLTNADGTIELAFNLPSRFEDGRAIGNGELIFVATTGDGLFSAETRVAVNISNPVATINTGLPTPEKLASVSISPDHGTVGTQININGRDFAANQRVNIHIGNVTVGATNAIYASAYSDANGFVSLTFNMPGVYADGSPIVASQLVIVAATDDFKTSAALNFNFTPVSQAVQLPRISLSPTSIKLDKPLTVNGTGFSPNASIDIWVGPVFNELLGKYQTVTTDGNGSFSTSFKLPIRWQNERKVEAKRLAIVAIPQIGASANATITIIGGGDQPPVDTSDDTGDTGDDTGDTGDDSVDTDDDTGDTGDDSVDTGDDTGDTGDDSVDTGDDTGDTGDDSGDEEPVVTPASVGLSSDNVAVNSGLNINGQNFAPSTTVNIQFSNGDGITSSIVASTDETGGFSTDIVLPAEVTAGTYTVFVSDTSKTAQTILTVSE